MEENQSSSEESFVVIEGERSLTIQHRQFGAAGRSNAWEVMPVDTNYLILSKSKVSLANADGYAFVPVPLFKDILIGLAKNKWSGVIKLDCNGFMKKIFFKGGNLCFASSMLIDDRLGERLYRTGRITIEELVNSASQVERTRKFGQILIQSSVMNAVELWEALKDQVLEIFRSVFIADFAKFVMEEGEHKAFMEVVYENSSAEIIDECYSYACMLRDFGKTLPTEASVEILKKVGHQAAYAQGTFVGDMLELIKTTTSVGELLSKSKLRTHNTVAVLLELVNQGVCRVTVEQPEAGSLKDISSKLNAKIDLYSLLLKQVKQSFEEHELKLPIADLRSFALGINADGDTAFALDEHGNIDRNCRRNIYSQCISNQRRVRYFNRLVESTTQFLLQLTIDLAPSDVANDIRKKYREMT